MDWTNWIRNEWPALLITVILLLTAFAVPILGPLRSSDARVIIAVAALLVGAGLALLAERGATQPAGEETSADASDT